MTIHSGVRSPSQPETPLDRLVRARGLQRFAYFFVTGEGDYLPNGDEEKSGNVIDERGRVFSFWTGWDPSLEETVFSEWDEVEPEAEWLTSREYRQACTAVGLGVCGTR